MKTGVLVKFYDSDDMCAMLDGKIIARKSLYEARVYPDNSLESKLIVYKSRIQHCGSCIEEARYGYGMDECCCIHSSFHNKKEENEYVKSIGFWSLEEQ